MCQVFETLFLFILVSYGFEKRLYNLQEKLQFTDSKKAMLFNHKVKNKCTFSLFFENMQVHTSCILYIL